MTIRNTIFAICGFLTFSSCAALRSGSSSPEAALEVSLKVNSLQAKEVQEKGMLGSQDGDELTLVYSLSAYDAKGTLISVNNGYWGTRTIAQGTLIKGEEFDPIRVRIPREGKVIASLSLLEIDDYKGERRIAQVKSRTKKERQPSYMRVTSFADDQNLSPLQLVSQSLAIAGYKNFTSKHLTLSTNDDLGGTKKVLEAPDLDRIQKQPRGPQETVELDGRQINEDYLYVLKYNLEVSQINRQGQSD